METNPIITELPAIAALDFEPAQPIKNRAPDESRARRSNTESDTR